MVVPGALHGLVVILLLGLVGILLHGGSWSSISKVFRERK